MPFSSQIEPPPEVLMPGEELDALDKAEEQKTRDEEVFRAGNV